jgi:hypothetical protein
MVKNQVEQINEQKEEHTAGSEGTPKFKNRQQTAVFADQEEMKESL